MQVLVTEKYNTHTATAIADLDALVDIARESGWEEVELFEEGGHALDESEAMQVICNQHNRAWLCDDREALERVEREILSVEFQEYIKPFYTLFG